MTRSTPGWVDQFEEYARRKTQLAASMPLSPYVTELDNPDEHVVAVGSGWSRALFDGPFYLSPAGTLRRPATSLVFVQSSDGNTVAPDPALLGGGNTDKHLIYEGLSRVAAHAVLAGAETVRRSRVVFSVWHPELVALRASLGLPRHPVQVVATIHGVDVDNALLFNVPDIPVLLLILTSAARQMGPVLRARPWITALPMDRPEDLQRVFEQLRSLGIARLSCVGGRVLAGHLLDAGLIDDVYLTTGPRAGGEPGTPLRSKPWRGRVVVRKRGTGVEEGVTFEHVLPTATTPTPAPPTTRSRWNVICKW